jgi:Holliday junction resolvase-like predicted endonuclease
VAQLFSLGSIERMDITKSSRHSKIAGDFGETLVLYWLSKHGFECASVDHTGIDLIARHPRKPEVMGISVKSRTRTAGTESEYVIVKSGDFDKVAAACEAFGCVPYFAIVVDAASIIRVFITSMEHFLELFPLTSAGGSGWKMSDSYLAQYSSDPKVVAFELRADMKRWLI